jgi:hypothetical protein
MQLNETILRQLDDWRPTERSTRSIQAEGWSVNVTADRNDELGTLVWDVNITSTAPEASKASLGDVESWAQKCAARVGALDQLCLLEIDRSRDEALLRSDKPTPRGDSHYYYELMLQGTREAKLRRYQTADAGKSRSQVAFPITHEALARVVGEVTGAE